MINDKRTGSRLTYTPLANPAIAKDYFSAGVTRRPVECVVCNIFVCHFCLGKITAHLVFVDREARARHRTILFDG